MKKKPTSSLGNFSKVSALSKNSTWRCLEVVSHGCPLVLLLISSSSVLKYGRSFTEQLCRSFLLTYPLGLWRSKCHCLSWRKHCSKLKVTRSAIYISAFENFHKLFGRLGNLFKIIVDDPFTCSCLLLVVWNSNHVFSHLMARSLSWDVARRRLPSFKTSIRLCSLIECSLLLSFLPGFRSYWWTD